MTGIVIGPGRLVMSQGYEPKCKGRPKAALTENA
jgi:hypothetical protein